MILLATILGGSHAENRLNIESDVYLGLDWFLLNLLFTGILFIPIERLFGRREQPIFRFEWREDLLYFTISSLMVQGLAFLSLAPSMAFLHHSEWATDFRAAVASQPIVVQFIEIMFLTDLVQYWMHRLFHRIPFLWEFHSVHHSAQTMDWLAGSRMHVVEIIILRGCTVFPMYALGFAETAMYAYIFFVYVFSTLVHANLRLDFGFFKYWFVTPLYHHWHHGIEREAIDVNFAVHFPIIDKIFGTYYLPEDGHWPTGYGIGGHPVPKGFVRQFLYPFVREKKAEAPTGGLPTAPAPTVLEPAAAPSNGEPTVNCAHIFNEPRPLGSGESSNAP
jgi:sterol desaturase/sphingolipid hydroxylase (fatty acid hydroxylase superfamily)